MSNFNNDPNLSGATAGHTTLAGSALDPNSSATSQGISRGASDLDPQRMHQDGIEHIKANSGLGSTATPASNPGATDSSAGLSSGSGGVSSGAYVPSPGTATTGADNTYGSTSNTGSNLTGDSTGANYSSNTGSGFSGDNTSSTLGSTSNTGSSLTGNNTSSDDRTPSAADVTRNDRATTENLDDATHSKAATHANADDDESSTKDTKSSKDEASKNRENKSAIPTAGGQRLGEQHWGESKVVPDLPPKQEETSNAGVSSAAGQPTDQVRDNTNANVGTATGAPGAAAGGNTSHSSHDGGNNSGEGKEKLVDKIKDKLHIGSSN